MIPSHARIGLALAAWLQVATPASAQDAGTTTNGQGDIHVSLQSIGGGEVNTLVQTRLGIDHCERNDAVVFRLDNVPSSMESIDIYTEGDDCNATTSRDEDTDRCRYLTTQPTDGNTQDVDVTVMAREFFESCDAGQKATLTVWFLSVPGPESSADVGRNYGTYELVADSQPPDAPSEVVGGRGENQIPIEWDTSDSDLERFIIFIDNNPTEGGGAGAAGTESAGDGGSANTGDCGSSVLQSGADAGDVPSTVRRKELAEPTATRIELGPDDIRGTVAAVAVVAVDEAGNMSPLSNIGCVRVEPTQSFWDRYEANGGAGQAGCPCSALGPVHAHSAWPVALALLFIRRSGRRRRSS
jgi:hypothetical protein